MIVGTLGKALGSYGAYVCGVARAGRAARQHRSPVHLLDRPAPAVGRRGAGGARAARVAARAWSSSCGATPPPCARRSAAKGSPIGGSRTQIVPVTVGDARRAMALCERTLEGGVFAQAIRPPTVPDGHVAAAADRDGQPPRRGAAARGAGDRPRGRRARGRRRTVRPRRSGAPRRRARHNARPLRHRDRHRGRQDGGRGGDRAHRGGRRRRVAVFKPAVSGLDERRAGPDHELLRRGRGVARSPTTRSRPTATARPSPASRGRARRRARSTRSGCADGGGRSGAGRRPAGRRGRRRLPRPADRRTTSSATCAIDLGLPVVIAAAPGLGHDQPHPADGRVGARAPGSSRRRSSSPPGPTARDESSAPTARRSRASARSPCARCERSTSHTRLDRWPALRV